MSSYPRAAKKRPHSPPAAWENRAGLAFVTPTFVVVLIVVVIPILWTVLLAFQNAKLVDIQGMGVFGNWSFHNFVEVFTSPASGRAWSPRSSTPSAAPWAPSCSD